MIMKWYTTITLVFMIYFISLYFILYMYELLKDKVWVKWLWYSVTYRIQIHRVKKDLGLLSEDSRFWACTDWLDEEHWFENYWFGRQMKKLMLKELGKFQNV